MCKIIPVLEKSRGGVWGRVERRWSQVQQKEVKVTELLQAEGKGGLHTFLGTGLCSGTKHTLKGTSKIHDSVG